MVAGDKAPCACTTSVDCHDRAISAIDAATYTIDAAADSPARSVRYTSAPATVSRGGAPGTARVSTRGRTPRLRSSGSRRSSWSSPPPIVGANAWIVMVTPTSPAQLRVHARWSDPAGLHGTADSYP